MFFDNFCLVFSVLYYFNIIANTYKFLFCAGSVDPSPTSEIHEEGKENMIYVDSLQVNAFAII